MSITEDTDSSAPIAETGVAVSDAPPFVVHIVYQFFAIIVFALILPYFLVYHAVRHAVSFRRPCPTWSLRRDLAVATGRLYLTCTTILALPAAPGASAWQEPAFVRRVVSRRTKVCVVKIPPVAANWITGIAKMGAGIIFPVPVPGFWTFEPTRRLVQGDEPAEVGERVIMYVAGGSWVMNHPQGTPFPYAFCSTSHRRVLAVNHRKALDATTAFPAQLLDLAAGYSYLLFLGFSASNITLIGDSSGGHLVLALSRYLAELDSTKGCVRVGMPGAMLLVSPSCDLSHPPAPASLTDFLVPYLNQRVYLSLARHFAANALATNPYFSPAISGSFAYLRPRSKEQSNNSSSTTENGSLANGNHDSQAQTKVWIQYGGVENLKPDIDKLIKRMRTDMGNDADEVLEVDVVKEGVHLDAGIAYALGERGKESSWTKLLGAVQRYA